MKFVLSILLELKTEIVDLKGQDIVFIALKCNFKNTL